MSKDVTRWRMKFLWQWCNPRMSIRNQDLTSAGWNIMDLSLIRISKSESKNSRTRFRLFFEGYMSINYCQLHFMAVKYASVIFSCRNSWRYLISRIADMSMPPVRLDQIWITIFELSDFDAFNGDPSVRSRLLAQVDNGILPLSDFLLFGISMFGRRHFQTEPLIRSEVASRPTDGAILLSNRTNFPWE